MDICYTSLYLPAIYMDAHYSPRLRAGWLKGLAGDYDRRTCIGRL
jgi:hypothetical protein